MPIKRLRAGIIGGGIGGLSAANALVRRGVDVTVFEQADALGEVGAGVFIYPNALRQLERRCRQLRYAPVIAAPRSNRMLWRRG
jgi:2-polyprenyl-6-methoxyphenol hydroxylase-like FAD-dependent oxidoreductase